MLNTKSLNALLMSLMLFSGIASAHVELYDARPAADSMLESAPNELFLSFSGDVRVVKLKLTDSNAKGVNFGFKPVVNATDEMSWELPPLSAGKYTVQWTVMGEDGHTFQDSYAFHIHGSQSHHDH